MKNILPFALLASMAMSAPTQGYAHDEAVATTIAEQATSNAFAAPMNGTVLHAQQVADIEFASLNAPLLAAGCCDQGYEIKSSVQAPGCCDQGYVVNSTAATPAPLLALVLLSALALAWTHTNHFKTLLARWTLAH